MTLHELKTIQPYYDAIVSGEKTFEVRKNDRDFHMGDELLLREWDGSDYTGREHGVTVTYLTNFEQQPGYVVMGIAALPEVSLEELLLATLVDGSLPGRDVRIAFNDGSWHIAQEYCGLDESYPTGIVGSGETIRAAITDANQAKGGK